ncbi:hypothetical protein ONZ45_g12180 [Pleurotus djamor]|nr:hypothetical protein ONZ45_g12180 [Pleurotus djamor]
MSPSSILSPPYPTSHLQLSQQLRHRYISPVAIVCIVLTMLLGLSRTDVLGSYSNLNVSQGNHTTHRWNTSSDACCSSSSTSTSSKSRSIIHDYASSMKAIVVVYRLNGFVYVIASASGGFLTPHKLDLKHDTITQLRQASTFHHNPIAYERCRRMLGKWGQGDEDEESSINLRLVSLIKLLLERLL